MDKDKLIELMVSNWPWFEKFGPEEWTTEELFNELSVMIKNDRDSLKILRKLVREMEEE